MRCQSRRGALQCDKIDGHRGECETTLSARADAEQDPEAERLALRLAVRRLHGVLRDIQDGDTLTVRVRAAEGLALAERALRLRGS